MDRRRAEIRSSSERLKVECQVVIDSLNKIRERDNQSVNYIESLSDKQILANAKHFLEISQFQSNALQKILQVGLELEVFLSSDLNELPTNILASTEIKVEPIAEESGLNSNNGNERDINDTTPKNSAEFDGTCNIKNEETQIPYSEKIEHNNKYEIIEIQTIENDDKKNKIHHNKDQSTPVDIEEDITVYNKPADNLKNMNENIPEKDNIEAKDCQITRTNTEEAALIETAIKYETFNYETLNISPKSDSSEYPAETDKDTCKKTSSNDSGDEKYNTSTAKTEQVQTLHDKLKSKKLLSRKDRYLQNLPKPNIPDLSFKPSSKTVDVSDNFMSCKDSSSSCSSIPKETKKKKKRSESSIVKEEKIEILKVPHLTLQDSPAPRQGMLCVVSRAQSPSEIYITVIDDNISLIDCLGLQIGDLYDCTSCPFENKEDAKEKLGKYCVVYLEEYKIWYRAEVLNWHMKGKSYLADIVTIQLVDYGHVNDISYKNLRQLIVDFCHIPKCAIKCHLAALYPPTSTPGNLLEVWPMESFRIFHNIFHDVNNSVYKVIYVDDMKDSWAIDLLDEKEEDEELSIGQQLINAEAAVEIIYDPTQIIKNKFCIDQLQTAQGFHGISMTMQEEQKLECYFNNDRMKEPSNLDEAMVNYKANDEARTCRFAQPNGTCFKGSRCKLDHRPLRKDGITTDKQSMFKSAFNDLVLPRTGEHIFLQVTNVININMFYACQVERMNSASYSAGLIRLLKLMNLGETIQKYKPLRMVPSRGEIVIVKSWNGTWYRAQVQEVFNGTDRNEEIIQVFIVDFGELIDVTMNDLRQVIPDYLHLPFQAILCRLYNVNPKKDVDEMAAKEYFESHFLCQCFKAEVMYASSSILEVLLTKCDNEDVGQQIIDDEFGTLRTEYFFPQKSETLLVD